MPKILITGRSHAMCISAAARLGLVSEGWEIETLALSGFSPPYNWKTGELSAEFAGAIREKSAEVASVVVITQGNQHSAISLVRQNPPIDFVYSGSESHQFDPDALLVPEAAIMAWYRDELIEVEHILRHLAATTELPVFVMGPPPPLKEASDVSARLDPVFTERYGAAPQISPATTRIKAWRLMDDAFRDIAREHQVSFVPVPPQCLDGEGFLSVAYCAGSATHADQNYGAARVKQVISQLVQLGERG